MTNDPSRLAALLRLRLSPTGVFLGLGLLFRVAHYLADREYWLDETFLAGNIANKTFAELAGPLSADQLAPLGFLWAEQLVYLALGGSALALRLIPLASGVAALFLFLVLARRCLEPRTVPVALALCAIADDLIYFSAELKPYSGDVAAALLAERAAVAMRTAPLMARRILGCGAIGAVLVWFSFPVVFILAGTSLALVGSAVWRRDGPMAVRCAAVGLIWAVAWAASYSVVRIQLHPDTGMWVFWSFAFPPQPLEVSTALIWAARRFLNLFVNPLSFPGPIGPYPGGLLALGLLVIGCGSLWRRDRLGLALLMLPMLLTLAAALVRLYPFHGRLILFLTPALLLLIAEGIDRLRGPSGRPVVFGLIVAVLLAYPALTDLYHVVVPRQRIFDAVGDYRSDTWSRRL
ncbi:MAG: hypothetical protein IRY99_13580 [Isosphaeraceae bacterium]|nr:hypothetical protein [Isosphaeraceae bacterium]